MLPFEQGGLDSLCGIYGIVNAERVVNNSSVDQAQTLFNKIIKYLDQKKMLGEILVGGMLLKNVKVILTEVVGERIPYQKIHFAGWENPDLDAFWIEIMTFLNGNMHRAVLLSLSGYHDHFTVIRGITEKQIQLFDSNELFHLNRANCTTSYATARRHHVLYPAQTYFLGRG